MNHHLRPITLRDIAKMIGVSHSTVSRALRNDPQIPKERCIEIQGAAANLGYRVNPAAAALSNLRQNSSKEPANSVIAWLNFWPNDKQLRKYREFDLYWQGAESAATGFGFRLEEFTCSSTIGPQRLLEILYSRGILAILVPPMPAKWPPLNHLMWNNFSVVRFGRSLTSLEFHVVTADQSANSVMAVTKIRALGYERIGWVDWHKEWEFSRLFKAGFLLSQFRGQAGMPIPPLSLNFDTPAQIQRTFHDWLLKERPDAILTDMAEIRLLLDKVGWRIPSDIGLAANSVLDGNADAGINQNSFEIGRVAVCTLMSLVRENERGIPAIHREILIPGEWVDGASLPSRH